MKEIALLKDTLTKVGKDKEQILYNDNYYMLGDGHAIYFLSEENYLLNLSKYPKARAFSDNSLSIVLNSHSDEYEIVEVDYFKKLNIDYKKLDVTILSNGSMINSIYLKYFNDKLKYTYLSAGINSPLIVKDYRDDIRAYILPIRSGDN